MHYNNVTITEKLEQYVRSVALDTRHESVLPTQRVSLTPDVAAQRERHPTCGAKQLNWAPGSTLR